MRPGAGGKPRIVPLPRRDPRWYVYQSHPQAERLSARELTRAGYRGYLPLIASRRPDPFRRSVFHKTLVCRFVGYGFVELGPYDPWAPVQHIAGVARFLLGCDGRPAPVSQGEIESHMADDERLCDLARETLPPIPVGKAVMIVDGPMTSFPGTVIECDGFLTTVEVVIFNRLVPARFDRAAVEVV